MTILADNNLSCGMKIGRFCLSE